MSEHTKGRLRVHDGQYVIKDEGGFPVARTNIEQPQAPGMTHANARRLVACWNACLGWDTEYLEKIVEGKDEQAPFDRVAERDRDELIAALRPIAAAYPDDPGTSDLDNEQPVSITLGDLRRVWLVLAKHEPKKESA